MPMTCVKHSGQLGVSEGGIVWIRAMCLSIRPRRDPALTIRGRYGLDSNESADTTDGEQRRYDERLSHRSGRRLTSGLSKQFYKSQAPPLSFPFTRQTGNSNAAMC